VPHCPIERGPEVVVLQLEALDHCQHLRAVQDRVQALADGQEPGRVPRPDLGLVTTVV